MICQKKLKKNNCICMLMVSLRTVLEKCRGSGSPFENVMTKELNKWCLQNKLTVSTEKTFTMIIAANPCIPAIALTIKMRLTEVLQSSTERGGSKYKFVIVRPRTEHDRNSLRHRDPLTWNLLNVKAEP